MEGNEFKLERMAAFRRPALLLAAILSLAFALRVARCFLTDRVDKDSVLYVEMARDWVQKGVACAFDRNQRIPPLYVALMAAGESCGFGAERAGRAVSVVAGTFAILAVFMIGRAMLSSEALALAGAFLAAVHPYLIRISEDVLRDSLFVCLELFTLAFAALGASRERAFLWWAACGCFAALGCMTRSEGMVIFPVLAIWILTRLVIERSSFWRELGRLSVNFTCCLAAFAIVSFPVELAFKDTSSEWTVIDKRTFVYLKGAVAQLQESFPFSEKAETK